MAPAEEFTLWTRASGIDGVKESFSSWDACMARSYCKYPLIAGIVVGSLIVISLIWCLIACLCCGYNCCKACCCCCSSGKKSKSSKRSKFADDDPSPFGRPAPPPANPNGVNDSGSFGYQRNPPLPSYDSQRNQTAQFDAPPNRNSPAGKKANDDALPAMPTWDGGRDRRVEDSTQDVEMNRLDPVAAHHGNGRSRQGYHEVPSSPAFSADGAGGGGYRGTEPTNQPVNPTAIGVAHSPGYDYDPHYDNHNHNNPYGDPHHPGGGVGGAAVLPPRRSPSPYRDYNNPRQSPRPYPPSVGSGGMGPPPPSPGRGPPGPEAGIYTEPPSSLNPRAQGQPQSPGLSPAPRVYPGPYTRTPTPYSASGQQNTPPPPLPFPPQKTPSPKPQHHAPPAYAQQPYAQQQPIGYAQTSPDPQDTGSGRPPSLLQAGRKMG